MTCNVGEAIVSMFEALECYDGEAAYTIAENGDGLSEAWINICKIAESRSDRVALIEGYLGCI